MVVLRHPLSGTRYEKLPTGDVRVGEGDEVGVFSADGRWLAGERRTADPQMCRWVAEGEPRRRSARYTPPPTS